MASTNNKQPHRAEEQLAGQAGEQVHVQAEHQVGEAAAEVRLVEHRGGPGIDHDAVQRLGRGGRGRRHAEPDAGGLVRVPDHVLHHLAGPAGLRRLHHPVEVGGRRARGHRRRLRMGAEQVVDLVVEDQRQAGQVEQQQEHRADQARPGVNAGPGPQGAGAHGGRHQR
jgi:hypothetical protein